MLRKSFCQKQLGAEIIFEQEKFGDENNFMVSENCWLKKILCRKIFFAEIIFEQEKFGDEENFMVSENSGLKKTLCRKNVGPKKNLVRGKLYCE